MGKNKRNTNQQGAQAVEDTNEQNLDTTSGAGDTGDNGGAIDTTGITTGGTEDIGATGDNTATIDPPADDAATIDNGGEGGDTAEVKPADPAPAPEAPAAPAPAPAPEPVKQEVKIVQRGEAIMGEVKQTGELASQEQLAATIKARGMTSTASAIDEQAFFFTGKGFSSFGEGQLMRLHDYIQAMQPNKPMDVSRGANHQRTLYRTIMAIVNNSSDEEFHALFTALVEQFTKHASGCFAEEAVMRFADQVPLNPEERKTWYNIVNLLKIIADPKGGELRLRQVDFNKTWTKEVSETARQRILAFVGK